MPQPIDYTLNVERPSDAILRGIKKGAFLKGMRQQEEVAQRRSQVLAALGPNSSLDDYLEAAKFIPPEQLKQLLDIRETKSEEERESEVEFLQQLLIVDLDTAIGMIKDRSQAARNVGDISQAKVLDAWGKSIKISPEALKHGVSVLLSQLDPDALQGVLDIRKSKVDIAKKEAELTPPEDQEVINNFATSLGIQPGVTGEEQIEAINQAIPTGSTVTLELPSKAKITLQGKPFVKGASIIEQTREAAKALEETGLLPVGFKIPKSGVDENKISANTAFITSARKNMSDITNLNERVQTLTKERSNLSENRPSDKKRIVSIDKEVGKLTDSLKKLSVGFVDNINKMTQQFLGTDFEPAGEVDPTTQNAITQINQQVKEGLITLDDITDEDWAAYAAAGVDVEAMKSILGIK